jgi:hypothetical protein
MTTRKPIYFNDRKEGGRGYCTCSIEGTRRQGPAARVVRSPMRSEALARCSPRTSTRGPSCRPDGSAKATFRLGRAVGTSLYALGGGHLLAFDEPAIGITGAILFGFRCLVFVTRSRLRQANRRTAVAIICIGILVTTLIVVMLQPTWSGTLAVTPLLTVGVALPTQVIVL